MSKTIVFVEDDEIIRENYSELLRQSGFQVDSFASREQALAVMQNSLPDLAILDVTLDNERDAGFQLCADLRAISPTLPIVFLTSHDSEIDKISGLRLGADDYITKDCSIEYVIVRIETLFRRLDSIRANVPDTTHNGRFLSHDGSSLRLDKERCEAYWGEQKIPLPLTHFWIVECLYSAPGQVKRASELMAAANIVVEPNTITAHVKAIREAFKAIDSTFRCIKTERGKGYRWLDD